MIKVFVGTEPAQWLPTEVLKWSTRRRTNAHVEFIPLEGIPLNFRFEMYTGFSFYRFAIPELCHYKGQAIYLDADMVVQGDIQALWELDKKGKNALALKKDHRSWYTSVMLLDCSNLTHWKVDEWVTLINGGMASYGGTLSGAPSGLNHFDFGPLPEVWNHLDTYDTTTQLIHYTEVPRQPWKVPGHPHAHVFLKELVSALKEGVVTEDAIREEIDKEHIYPGILEDASHFAP